MAKINKQEVIQKLVDELNLYPGKDLIPSELADKILAVYQINAGEVAIKQPTATFAESSEQILIEGVGAHNYTIYTAPATGKTYITGATLSVSQNSAAGTLINLGNINVLINEVRKNILSICIATAIRDTHEISLTFQNPILVDAGSTIQLTATHAYDDQDMAACGFVVGYTE